jgi:hypothetical protein
MKRVRAFFSPVDRELAQNDSQYRDSCEVVIETANPTMTV